MKPNVLILTIGRCGSSVMAKMMMQAGWKCPRADEEFGEHQDVREINRAVMRGTPFPTDEARRIIDAMESPWVLKDPRLAWTLKHWQPLMADAKPSLVMLTRDLISVSESFRRQKWGKDGPNGYEFLGVTLARQEEWCRTYFESWPWGRLHFEYEQLHAAMRLFDVSRGDITVGALGTGSECSESSRPDLPR
jgi:hypothetical protein